ncbi:MAG: 3'-5' exonuclease [Clostridia bacterium]|nr:3'-5' exonuclease [Clostridia bacterium]
MTGYDERILPLRKKVIENYFDNLNDMQKKAVLKVSGPLLILAGAGSGKTTVIINRIINIIKFGKAYESDTVYQNISDQDIKLMKDYLENNTELPEIVIKKLACCASPAFRILAITFTNKAANELKERLFAALGEEGKKVFASTFHSFCVRILRQNADLLGYDKHFTIYDTADIQRAIKSIYKKLDINDQILKIKSAISEISKAKEQMLNPKQFSENAGSDYRLLKIAEVYKLYYKLLKESNAMDFDDLLLNTVKLFTDYPDVLQKYKDKFDYIMVDEYQDTNPIQYKLIKLLTNDECNLCVVGDDDQSIYKFRGATIENILNFEQNFPNTEIIRLEQNYRSTQNILNAANDIIKNNDKRKPKRLWTQNQEGNKVSVHTSCNEQKEAMFIADKIQDAIANGKKYSDCTVLYRMNTQALPIEKVFIKSGIPYRKLSGHRITDAEEIKDVVSYLSVLNNPYDNLRLRRIINKPKRSIGDKTTDMVESLANELGISMFEVISRADEFAALSKAAAKLLSFYNLLTDFIEKSQNPEISISKLYGYILEKTNFVDSLKNSKDEKKYERIDNILEFQSNIINFERENEDASLESFLEEFALISDIDNYNESEDAVVMMTIHSAKGLEFPVVFLPGFENGVFPSIQSLYDDELKQEERRLAYVAVTRAKEQLYIINCDSRMVFGRTSYNKLSEFVNEIDSEYIQRSKEKDWLKLTEGLPKYKSVKDEKIIAVQSAHMFNRHKTTKASANNFVGGERVMHKVFGTGTILSVKPMGNDALLEIHFDKVGNKKIMSNFAKLKII